MAGDSVIAALRVVFGADMGTLEDGFTKAERRLIAFSTNFARAAAGVAAAGAALGAAVAHTVKNALEEIDSIGRMSTKFSASTEELSKLKYVADAAGAGFEGLAGKMREALTDATSDGASALKAMGVAATDAAGNVRPMTDVLSDVAAKFATYRDGADKVTLGTKLFGDEVDRLMPILNRGAPGIAGMAEEAKRFGLVISGQTAEAAGRFAEVVNKVKAAAGLGLQLAEKLGPLAAELAEKFFTFVKSMNDTTNASGGMKLAMETAALAFKSVASAIVIAGAGMLAFLEAARGMVNFFSAPFSGEWSKDLEKLKSDFAGLTNVLSGTKDILGTIWGDVAAKAAEGSKALQNANAPAAKSFKDIQDAAKAAFTELMNSPWQDVATKMAAVEQALADNLITKTDAARMRMRLLTEEWRLQRDEAKATLDTMLSNPWEDFTSKVKALEEAMRSNTIRWAEFNDRMKQVHAEHRRQWDSLASTAATALTTIFDKSKTAAIAASIINTAQGITKALADGGMFGWAQAALIAATGAAQIAKIRSTTTGGGGSAPSAPAGNASIDPAGAGGAGQDRTLFIQGLSPGDIFGAEAVRALMEKMLGMQRDGYNVVVR